MAVGAAKEAVEEAWGLEGRADEEA